ncbi:unnamed protein product [Rotaria sp. Silwood1]|nr:unnamed protein product [Rotaria sp. Silwood1]
MDDADFDQVPQILFSDVSSLKKRGCPGTLIPLTHDTRAVLCGNNSSEVIVVATRFGHGRCLVFAHCDYPNIFLNVESEDQNFIDNCRQWLARGENAQFESIDEVSSMNDVQFNRKILVWNGHCTKDDAFMNDLCAYLQQGGALICGSVAWGWLQINKGKFLSDFPFARFCDYIGVKLTDNYTNCPDPILFRPELIKFKNIYHVAQELANDPNNITKLAIIGSAIKELGDTLPNVAVKTLQNIVLNAGSEVVPASNCPIQDKCCREQSIGLCGILCGLPGITAPGVKNFPGDFDQSPRIETDVICHMESNVKEWYCTGYYVAAGITIQIDLVEQEGATGWSAHIGCHSDNLGSCSELRRWPCISMCKPLIGISVRMSSAFGGLLFLQSPDGESNSITVCLHHVVLTPTYDLTDPDRETAWQDRHQYDGLWADIAGKHIVFNLPSKSIRDLDSTQLDQALQFWDTVVLAHHELRGTTPKKRERIVCDEQPSVGYMRKNIPFENFSCSIVSTTVSDSGYPIVTHLDVSDPNGNGFLLNGPALERNGSWGLFHELGHNMQRDWWTFAGTIEVTVNIFTLHAMHTVCHLRPWLHSWLQNEITIAKKYIENGSKFNEWKESPGIALFVYAQLAREYGWDNFKAVFHQYEQTQPDLHNDQEKMDRWIETFSRQVGYNLIPLFKFWGFPVSQSTIDALRNLEIAMIVDEFIEMAPERYQI